MSERVSKLQEVKNDVVVTDHLNIARYWAFKFGAKRPVDDSVQYAAGCVGLLSAKKYFNPAINPNFSTYATYWVKEFIRREVLLNHNSKFKRYEPSFTDMGFHNDCRKGGVFDSAFDPTVSDEVDPSEEASFKDLSSKLMSVLPLKYRDIVQMRLDGYTLDEIGRKHRVTRERVRQLFLRSVSRVKRIPGVSKIVEDLV